VPNAGLEPFLTQIREGGDGIEIVTGEASAERYRDPFALVGASRAPAGVRPAAAGDVQRIVAAANRFGVPLWPISRGENLGYGGAAPFDETSVTLDLSRMNRILEVNAEDAFCSVEPGVSFEDMFEHIDSHDLPLWLSVPGYGAGSMMANALERGVGNALYGDHSSQICGMEVILGDGELVRTGMGSIPESGMWHRQKASLGPRFDELFLQSSFGVVTKMGLWLMPAPAASAAFDIALEERDALGGLVEVLKSLKRAGIIQDAPVISSFLTIAALRSKRSDWAEPGAPLTEDVAARICAEMGCGWWNARLRLYGMPDMVETSIGHVEDALALLQGCSFSISRWRQGDAMALAHRGVPSRVGLGNVRWCGASGAHIDYSVCIPVSGAEAVRQMLRTQEALSQLGLDYHSTFYLRERHMLNVMQILFDQDDGELCAAVDALIPALIADAAARGFGLYRSPLRYREIAMRQMTFGNDALARLHGRLKRALDPNEILSPGKDGF
jgi:4-cresol dehydrogenase (hydroxylating)